MGRRTAALPPDELGSDSVASPSGTGDNLLIDLLSDVSFAVSFSEDSLS